MPNPYHSAFLAILESLGPTDTIELNRLLEADGVPRTSVQTRKNHLRKLIDMRPDLMGKVVGFYPSAQAIIAKVETKLGNVVEASLEPANREARDLIRAIGRPIMEGFVRETLAHRTQGNVVSLTVVELMDFLLDDFNEFQKAAGNGLVSIAGTINEALLRHAMVNGGMIEGEDFLQTGTRGQGDIVIYTTQIPKESLGVEVKSYAARERLLRGLHDIKGVKVGAGFFTNPAEFNRGRTVMLLETEAAAVYLPSVTLERVAADARSITTNSRLAFQSRFYRPLEQFVSDMKHYHHHAKLPPYQA